MNEAVRQLFDMPPEVARLPRDPRGYPIPAFVGKDRQGKFDFRLMDPDHWTRCVKQKVCWICGGGMGKRGWFCAGPMCTITRTTSEPPSHRLCAEFAAKNCPFLTRPLAKYNRRDLPEGVVEPAGEFIDRNPGCMAIWETRSYKPFSDGRGGALIKMGDPDMVTWWAQGRRATTAEVMESIESGLPALTALAKEEGDEAMLELTRTIADWTTNVALPFLPREAIPASP